MKRPSDHGDADLLYGPRTLSAVDTYILCEINISSVFVIPDEAPAAIRASCIEKGYRAHEECKLAKAC
jgi:hypothetical protein